MKWLPDMTEDLICLIRDKAILSGGAFLKKWLGWMMLFLFVWLTIYPAYADEATKRGKTITLRVMSYNIRYGAGMDGNYDLDRIASVIRDANVDVVGLQEVDVHWGSRSRFENGIRILADKLNMYAVFAHIYRLEPLEEGKPYREFGVALLSRYPIVHSTNHSITRLSTQEPDPVPQLAPGFLEANIQVRGLRLPVYVTHLDFRPDPSVRVMQVADMIEIMNHHRDKPHLLVGDFNAIPTADELSPLYERFRSALKDQEENKTYPANEPVKQIDYIWVSRHIDVLQSEVIESEASDHRPVIADLLIKR